MHELSIAHYIKEVVKKEATKMKAKAISEVKLEVGELAGVELEALQFAWESIRDDELLKGVELKVEIIEGKAICNKCHKEFSLHDYFELCPECDSYENEILKGKELRIKSIDIEC